jgi:hypothetical protein
VVFEKFDFSFALLSQTLQELVSGDVKIVVVEHDVLAKVLPFFLQSRVV